MLGLQRRLWKVLFLQGAFTVARPPNAAVLVLTRGSGAPSLLGGLLNAAAGPTQAGIQQVRVGPAHLYF